MDYKEKVIAILNSQELSKEQKEKLEEIFPELKESEDERVREALIHLVNSNKELSFGIDNYDGIKWGDILAWLEKQGEPDILIEESYQQQADDLIDMVTEKSAWSEEDEKHIESILKRLDGMCKKGATFTKTYFILSQDMDWLKSLKDKVQPQPKQEWRQENTGDLTDFENAMMHIGGSFFGENAGLDPNDTNAIKEQANILLGLVPKQEWILA